MGVSLDGVLIKKAHQKVKITAEEIKHLEKCMDPVTGPLYFCKNFVKIRHPTQGPMLLELYEFQERLVEVYHNYRYSIAMLPRQMGKALANTTPILTTSGFKPLGELQVNDTIFGPDGLPTQVTFITETMLNRRCFDLTFSNGTTITADADHLWTWRVNNQLTTGTTIELIAQLDLAPVEIDHTALVNFSSQPTPINPYVYAVFLANYYNRAAPESQLSLPHFTLNSNITIPSTITFNKIPEEFLINSVSCRTALLQGLMDNFGSYNPNTNTCTFEIDNSDILTQFQTLLASLGNNSLRTKSSVEFKPTVNPFYAKKYQVTIETTAPLTIVSYRQVKSVPVRCLQVNNQSRLFLAGSSLIPTHNTTCAAAYLLWYTQFVPSSHVLIAAHKYTGASEIMDRYRFAYESLPDFLRAGVHTYNRNTIEYDNGSKIQATTTTADTGRGKSLSLIYIDEMAFVDPPEKAREFWTALSPTLSTGGKCIITSTPNSDEDQFAIIWKDANNNIDEHGNENELGINGFKPFFAHWRERPGRDDEWAKAEEAKIGKARFDREFNCKFLVYEETLINPHFLAELKGEEPSLMLGQTRFYKDIDPNSTYVVALDPSLGTGGDYSAIQVFELPSMTQIGEWRHNLTPIQMQVKYLKDITHFIYTRGVELGGAPTIYYSVENNTVGESALICIEHIGEENIHGMFMNEPFKRGHVRKFRRGFNTTSQTKLAACSQLKHLIETKRLKIKSKALISELKNYISRGVGYGAKSGEHDDLVSAMLIIIRMISILAEWDPKFGDIVSQTVSDTELPMPIFISSY